MLFEVGHGLEAYAALLCPSQSTFPKRCLLQNSRIFEQDADLKHLPGSGRRWSSTFNSDVPQQGVMGRISHFKYFVSTGRKQGSSKHDFVYPNHSLGKSPVKFLQEGPKD